MDSLISAAARALAGGDALGALQRVALRDDPPALALRGIAMAQLGELTRARELLRSAHQAFGPREAAARARCVVAEAEVALAMRELAAPPLGPLPAAWHTLAQHGDFANAWHARLLAARRALLIGRLDEARGLLAGIDVAGVPPMLAAVAGLATAELALRSWQPATGRAALDTAQQAALRCGIPALIAEVAQVRGMLERPAARRLTAGASVPLKLDEVQALFAADLLVLDACRRGLAGRGAWLPLVRRPILFALAQALATAWPHEVPRTLLMQAAFRIRRPDETHRARLRVELGRLRALARPLAAIEATPQGYRLQPLQAAAVAVLAPPIEGELASVVALLADGAAWSTSALALALGASQRTVQRAMAQLEAAGRVHALGQARSRRWVAAPLVGFTTVLLLPGALPNA